MARRRLASLAGALGGRLAGSLAGQSAGGGGANPLDLEDNIAAAGATLVAHYEVPATLDANITVVTGVVSALADRTGAASLEQGTAANRPLYVASGGPGNEPYIDFGNGTNDTLAVTRALAQDHYSIYFLHRTAVNAPAFRQYFAISHSGGGTTSMSGTNGTLGTCSMGMRFVAAAQSASQITRPVANKDWWTLTSLRAEAAGAQGLMQGGAAPGGPLVPTGFSGNDELRAIASIRIGEAFGGAGGQMKMMLIVQNGNAAAHAAVEDYVRARWPSDVLAARPTIVGWGQSNMADRALYTANVPGFQITQAAYGGTYISQWLPAGVYHDILAGQVESANGQPLIIWMNQGERDAENGGGTYNQYATRLDEFHDAMVAIRGSNDIYYITVNFHDNFLVKAGYETGAPIVQAARTAWVAEDPTHRQQIDIMTLAGAMQADAAHYDATLAASYITELCTRSAALGLVP